MDGGAARVRVDRWLWAARFYKTRSQAAEAVRGGFVQVNGTRAKPSRDVAPGDRVQVTRPPDRWVVDVRATADRRGSAAVAATLYEETEASRANREERAAVRRLERAAAPVPLPAPSYEDRAGRPTKRDRRRYERTRDRALRDED